MSNSHTQIICTNDNCPLNESSQCINNISFGKNRSMVTTEQNKKKENKFVKIEHLMPIKSNIFNMCFFYMPIDNKF